jgi:hypothetical protein
METIKKIKIIIEIIILTMKLKNTSNSDVKKDISKKNKYLNRKIRTYSNKNRPNFVNTNRRASSRTNL